MTFPGNVLNEPGLARAFRQWVAENSFTIRSTDDPGHPGQRSKITQAMARLHRSLKRFPVYRRHGFQTTQEGGGGAPWVWRPLLDKGARAGFLFLNSQKYVPFHDHPGGRAVMLVLSGKLEIIQCDPPAEETANHPHDLAIRWNGTLKQGEGTFLTPEKGNIHSFRAIKNTLILDVFITPYPYGERTWFQSGGKFEKEGRIRVSPFINPENSGERIGGYSLAINGKMDFSPWP